MRTDPGVNFAYVADVAGVDEARDKRMEIADFLNHRKKYSPGKAHNTEIWCCGIDPHQGGRGFLRACSSVLEQFGTTIMKTETQLQQDVLAELNATLRANLRGALPACATWWTNWRSHTKTPRARGA